LEGDTKESREWREQPDVWWSEKLSIPNLTPRLTLQLMGTNVIRNNFHSDIWFLTLENRYRKNQNQHVVISDVRFPNEVDFIKNSGGILIRVQRGLEPEWFEFAKSANSGNTEAQFIMDTKYAHIHASETAWAGTEVDFIIDNNGTLEQLDTQIEYFINKYIK